jgi:hypothetical protein
MPLDLFKQDVNGFLRSFFLNLVSIAEITYDRFHLEAGSSPLSVRELQDLAEER